MDKKKYIEREAAIEMIRNDLPNVVNYHRMDAIECLELIPAADVVEVVRCKDCIFSHKDDDYHLGYTCEKPLYHPAIGEKPHRKLMQDCDYCSHGVRKTD